MRMLTCLVMMVMMSVQVFACGDGQEGLACFSPDGSILALSGNNCTVILWATATGRQIGQLYEPREEDYIRRDVWPRQQAFRPLCEVFISSFSPNGRFLYVSDWYGVGQYIWDIRANKKLMLKEHDKVAKQQANIK